MELPRLHSPSFIRSLLPLLFTTLIVSKSDLLQIHRETVIDVQAEYEALTDWEFNPAYTEANVINFRQSTSNQTCSCGFGVPRIPINATKSLTEDDITKIIGGVTSKNHSWPWAAAIVNVNSTPPFLFCGGSLIASQYILTAGHCLQTMKKNGLGKYRVYIGGNRINGTNITDRQIRQILAVKIHPGFVLKPIQNDIGLIKLWREVSFTNNINPVCLTQVGSPFVGNSAIVQGWGDTQFGSNNGSNSLREIHMTVISNANCSKVFSGISPNVICAQKKKKIFCNGDSGSGLVVVRASNATAVKFTQVGVASFTAANCNSTEPGVFQRVKNYISFIKSNLRNATTCSDTFT